ncbi:hypothetical protein PG995_002940 [Apiospora arundinis]
MKRKAASPTAGATRTTQTQPFRRQPQVSCDSCRRKKLKCDRGQPCGSCRTRGIACTTPSTSAPGIRHDINTQAAAHSLAGIAGAAESGGVSIHSILARVAALEQTVYRNTSNSTGTPAVYASSHPTPVASNASSYNSPSSHSLLDHERRQEAKFLDSAIDRSNKADQHEVVQAGMHFQVATSSSRPVHKTSTPKYRVYSSGRSHSDQPGTTWLMSREEALALLQDFVDNAYHLLHVLHIDTMHLLINEVYTQIEAGRSLSVNPAHAALIFSIAATTAFFWDARVLCQHNFESDEAAQQASLAWRCSALDLLATVQQSGAMSLEAAQAYTIVAYLYYNVDGQSAQFRLLHASSVAACREISLHLVDVPGSDSADDAATKEIKRRLWWHVAATDWMLGQNGGPLDGTYTIHPRHMRVAKPRNLNDGDLAVAVHGLTHPPEMPTQMSCFLQRIELAEVCRAVVDGYLPGESEISDYGQALALDQLFEQILVNTPQSLALHTPVPPEAPRLLCLHRATIQLGFYSRRARLHRPFLMRKDEDGRPGDPRYQRSREICTQSARTVLYISMALLAKSLSEPPNPQQPIPQILNHAGHEQCPGSPVHRLGLVIYHLFTACAVLALDSSIRTSRNEEQTGSQAADNEVQDALTCSCHLLAAAGKESAVAADLVRGLTGVLKRYRIKIKGAEKWSGGNAPEPQHDSSINEGQPPIDSTGKEIGDTGVMENGVIDAGDVHQLMHTGDAGDGFGLDHLWDDFLSAGLMSEDWDQIVTGLDSYCSTTQFG